MRHTRAHHCDCATASASLSTFGSLRRSCLNARPKKPIETNSIWRRHVTLYALLASTTNAQVEPELTATSDQAVSGGVNGPITDPMHMEPRFWLSNETRLQPVWQVIPTGQFDGDVPGHWHSKDGQDQVIWSLLGEKRSGFFIDLAANHPTFISNTRAVERDYGWRGLCVEANPRYWSLLRAVRSCTLVGVAVAAAEDVVTFVDLKKGGMGGISSLNRQVSKARREGLIQREFEARTVPFSKVLSHVAGTPHHIDYLSLDVEGAEALVISTFPFHTHTVALITIEADPKRAVKSSLRMKKTLMAHGYRRLCWLGGDEVWAHNATELSPAAQSRIALCSRCKPFKSLEQCKYVRHCETLAATPQGRWAGWNCSMSAKLPGGHLTQQASRTFGQGGTAHL